MYFNKNAIVLIKKSRKYSHLHKTPLVFIMIEKRATIKYLHIKMIHVTIICQNKQVLEKMNK